MEGQEDPVDPAGGAVKVTVARPLASVLAVRPGRKVPKSVAMPFTVMSNRISWFATP